MKIKKIEQLNDESKRARPRISSGLKVKTHVKAGPAGGINDIHPE